MENQHRKISNYRELSQEEIDLMNKLKAKEAEILDLLHDIEKYINRQINSSLKTMLKDTKEFSRLSAAEPDKWIGMAKKDIQIGFMEAVRSVAQPGG